jgi:hypothetical protein
VIDSCEDLKAGDVFTWENYPLFVNEQKDRRWFLFLGHRALESIVYQVTTTTQYEHYKEGGNRTKSNFFKIDAGVGGLIEDSIVDLTTYFERIPEQLINDCKSDIEKKGTLSQDWINKLVKHIKDDKHIPNIEKKDIYGYLRDVGFKING